MNREPSVYCERVLQDDLAVAYLRGDLPEPERDAFEQHCFECAACFERLQVVRDLQGMLRRDAQAAPRSVMPGTTARRPTGWLAWAAGAAFVAVGAGMVLRNLPTTPGPVPTSSPATSPAPTAGPASPRPERPPLEVLARFEPPSYAPLIVRGGEPANEDFTRAMERYVRGDYAGAASGLRAALRTDPTDLEARFYLGASELVAGQTDPAIRELERVAGGDDDAYAEAARYYLAKAHLAKRDVAAARRELQRVARGDGEHKERAQQLLTLISAEP